MGKTVSVFAVFGQDSSENPLSYVKRDIEADFRQALDSRATEAIVVYGTSSQGKSSLRRSVLPKGKCTYISATSDIDRKGLYQEILNQAGAIGEREHGVEKRSDQSWSLSLNPLQWIGGQGSRTSGKMNSVVTKNVAPDFTVTSTVVRHYKDIAGQKPIVIDNFHYIDRPIQAKLATDIRVFGEEGIKIVIFGTWPAKDYLQRLNGDLAGPRLRTLCVDPWLESDLSNVLDTGAKVLNIKFSSEVRAALIKKATNNVALLQDAARDYLVAKNIEKNCRKLTVLDDTAAVARVYGKIAEHAVSQTTNKLQAIAESGEKWRNGKTRMHWILRGLLKSQQIEDKIGVLVGTILEGANSLLAAESPKSTPLDLKTVAKAVKHDLAKAQVNMQTPILAYDENSERVFVLDSWVLFTLRRQRKEIARTF